MPEILAIDPGTEKSAYVFWSTKGGYIRNKGILQNEVMLDYAAGLRCDLLAIEMIASYGMSVGKEVFETCVWIGRFIQGNPLTDYTLVYRKDVKMHICGTTKAKDGNIRQALIDRFGGREKALGKKKAPGPLYGVAKDIWAALGVAITVHDRIRG